MLALLGRGIRIFVFNHAFDGPDLYGAVSFFERHRA
jgi:hypothetical protein